MDDTKHLIKTCFTRTAVCMDTSLVFDVISGMRVLLWPGADLHVSCHVLLTLAGSENRPRVPGQSVTSYHTCLSPVLFIKNRAAANDYFHWH